MSAVVAIIGASDKPHRYAHRAMRSLIERGYAVRLVNPYKSEIEGMRCYGSVEEIDGHVDTVTLYVNPQRFQNHIEGVIETGPRRVIMNPGTEDSAMEKRLVDAGIQVQRACTLVLLAENEF